MALTWACGFPGNLSADEAPKGTESEVGLADLSLEELMDMEVDVVYSASKYEQKTTDAPASVTIITADEIRLYGYRTLNDILQSVRGFYTTYDRNYEYTGVRGFGRPGDYNSRMLVLIDGNRTNKNVDHGATMDRSFMLDVDLIERVEIIRGPGSSLYGSNAFLGVVSVFTKKGEDIDGTELSGELASFDTQEGQITYGKLFDHDLDVLLSASAYDSEGDTLHYPEFDAPETNNGYVDNDDEDSFNLFAKIRYQELTFETLHVAREKGIPTAPWETVFGHRRTRTEDDSTMVSLRYDHEVDDTLSVMGRAVYNHYSYDGRYMYDWAEDTDPAPIYIVHNERWRGRWWEFEWQFIDRSLDQHTLTYGAEYRYNVKQNIDTWDEEVYLDLDRHSDNWGLYLQDEYRISEELLFNAGVRYDEYDSFGSTINPRFALLYSPVETTTLKLLYGEAFRAPSAYELYFHDGPSTQKPNPDLDPEEIETYEVVLEQQINPTLRGYATFFQNTIDDLIDQTTDPADDLIIFQNVDEVDAQGFELELEAKHQKTGIKGRASYAYVDTESDQTGKELVNSYENLIKFNLILPLDEERLVAGLETQYNSRTRTLSGTHADDYTVTNLTLTSVNLSGRLEVAASIYNVFDEQYDNPGFAEHLQNVIRQDGRTFGVKLTYRY
jgi:iron complex outermembrane receptor protein